jgi:hypothetical protein
MKNLPNLSEVASAVGRTGPSDIEKKVRDVLKNRVTDVFSPAHAVFIAALTAAGDSGLLVSELMEVTGLVDTAVRNALKKIEKKGLAYSTKVKTTRGSYSNLWRIKDQ